MIANNLFLPSSVPVAVPDKFNWIEKVLSSLMAEYWLPENRLLSIEKQRRLFEVKHRMTKIPSNFPKAETWSTQQEQ